MSVETLTPPYTGYESTEQEDRKEESEYTYEEGKNYWNPLITLSKIIPSSIESERHTQARKFIGKEIPAGCLTLCETELFIENDLFPYFSIAPSSRIATIIRKHYKEKCKEAKEKKKREERRKARNGDFDIAKEFEGLYEIEHNFNTGEPKRINAFFDQIAIRVIDNLNVIVYEDNIYCYRDGYYQNNTKLVKSEATRILNGIYKGTNSGDIKKHLTDVMIDIEHFDPVNEYPFQGVMNAINVSNGVIIFDEKTGERKRVDPDPIKYRFNYKLPIEYDENAAREFIINEFGKYTHKPKAIIQLIAQTLMQSMGYEPFKLAYLLYGPTNYGKSTLVKIIRIFIGKTLICGIGLNRMSTDGNNRFALAPLEGKLLNVKEEMAKFRMNDCNTFKEVTGSYDIDVEPKHVDGYTTKSTAVHMFLANDTPEFDTKVRDDKAFWVRWCLIPITKTEFKMNESYTNTKLLTDENMSGLLNEVLDMIGVYVKSGFLPHRCNTNDEWKKVREEWMQAGNPLYRFITENMEKGGETALIKDELLDTLKDWCEDGNILDPNSKPTTLNDLIDVIRICDGKIDTRREFYYDL